MPPIVIEAEGLGKRYHLGSGTSRHDLTELVLPQRNGEDLSKFWALRDVSFRIEEGDSVGIIGRNGAGKSTLLKLLARITAPTEGRARIRGRVGALLEVGTGFHQDLSGRDNVFLSGTILGQSYSDVKSKFDEIVDFSGVEKFIDTPVKRYSSGMQVRLAFSVALHLNAEIVFVDEVLSVGDIEFQRKSLRKLRDAVTKDGRTILFVTHGLAAVQKFCKRVLVLENGHLKFLGATEEGLEYYRNLIPFNQESIRDTNLRDRLKRADGCIRCTMVNAFDSSGMVRWTYREGENVLFRIEYEVMKAVPNLTFGFRLINPIADISQSGEKIVANIYETISRTALLPGYKGIVEIVLPNIKLRSFGATPYIWFSNIEDNPASLAYDVVDANVDLPYLYVRAASSAKYEGQGVVSLDHHLRAIDARLIAADRM